MPDVPYQIHDQEAFDSEKSGDLMEAQEVAYILKNNESMNTRRNVYYGLNKTRMHNHNETLPHFMVKAMLTYLIVTKKRCPVITEAELANGRCVDALQITKNKELVAYEIESNGTNNKEDVKGIDFIDIDLNKMPETTKAGLMQMKMWLNNYLVGE